MPKTLSEFESLLKNSESITGTALLLLPIAEPGSFLFYGENIPDPGGDYTKDYTSWIIFLKGASNNSNFLISSTTKIEDAIKNNGSYHIINNVNVEEIHKITGFSLDECRTIERLINNPYGVSDRLLKDYEPCTRLEF